MMMKRMMIIALRETLDLHLRKEILKEMRKGNKRGKGLQRSESK